jgi:hypothetical protein
MTERQDFVAMVGKLVFEAIVGPNTSRQQSASQESDTCRSHQSLHQGKLSHD